jgi:hypothetical protein
MSADRVFITRHRLNAQLRDRCRKRFIAMRENMPTSGWLVAKDAEH